MSIYFFQIFFFSLKLILCENLYGRYMKNSPKVPNQANIRPNNRQRTVKGSDLSDCMKGCEVLHKLQRVISI